MNLILFEPDETLRPLPRADERARHILAVLRRGPGEEFDAGLIDGPRGKATLVAIGEDALTLSFAWGEEPPPPAPITLVLGMPRPQTARKVLEEVTALGVAALHFVATDKGDPGYARSRLWSTREWRRHLIAGAEQAFSTRLPGVTFDRTLDAVLDESGAGCRIALDNYESQQRFGAVGITAPVVLAVGPERGWSARERDLLREQGFVLAHLGERVLRVETACVAAVALTRAGLGLI